MRRGLVIFGKEIKDTIRDRRTFIMIVIMPLFLYPLLFSILGLVTQFEKKKAGETIYTVGVVEGGFNTGFLEFLKSQKRIRIEVIKDKSELGKRNDLKCVIEVNNHSDTPDVFIYYDTANEESRMAMKRVKELLLRYKNMLVISQLKEMGINEGILNPFRIKDISITSARRMGGFLLGQIIPYLLIVVAFSSAIYTASDIVAGEKERRTLETLFVTNAGSAEIIIGKILTIFTISFSASVSALIGLSITFYTGFSFTEGFQNAYNISIPLFNTFFMLLVLLPLLWIFSSLLFNVACVSRTVRESNTTSTYILFGVIFLALFSIIRVTSPDKKLFFIPVLNTALLQQQILIGELNRFSLISVLTIDFLLCIALFLTAMYLFKNREFLLRS